MALVELSDFCPSCGHDFDCQGCPIEHDTESPTLDRSIGELVTYRRRLRRRTAAVVGHTDDGVLVLERGGKGELVRTKFANSEETGAILAIPSPLFRLESLAAEPAWSGNLAPWLDENRGTFLKSIGDRRQYALSAASSGAIASARASGLPESEINWLAMHVDRHSGDSRGAFHFALKLAPDAYPDHVIVMLEAVSLSPELLDEKSLADHADESLPSMPGHDLLRAALGDGADAGFGRAAKELGAIFGVEISNRVAAIDESSDVVDDNVWSRAATGAHVSVRDLDTIYGIFESVADDVIDSGRLDAGPDSAPESAYLRARTAIETTTDEELVSLGATREIARRAYLAKDDAKLSALMSDSPESAWDLQALRELQKGNVPVDVPDDAVLKAVAASIRSQRAHPNALVDASTWPVIGHLVTDNDAELFPQQSSIWQLEQAIEDIKAWNFESALTRARLALKWSDDEAIRDEALNVVAFALHQEGRDEEAIRALEKALEGEYSANLQANVGVVAADLQPEIAAHHLARLAEEAPTLDLRLAAVRHAFGIWTTSVDAWDEDDLVVPEDLLSTMREVLVADVPYDDYVPLIQLLVRADADWVADSENTKVGPHGNSAAAKVFRGKASDDPSDYVDALAAMSKEHLEEDWFVEELDRFVHGLRGVIFSDEAGIGPASYAFAAIDAGMELDDFDYVTLACGAAGGILSAIGEDGGLPSDKVVEMIETARSRAKSLEEDQPALVRSLLDMVGNQYGAVVGSFHAKMYDQIVEAVQRMSAQLYGVRRGQINWSAVEEAVRPMRRQAQESASEVAKAMVNVTDEDLKDKLRDLVKGLKDLASNLSNVRRMF